jgi:hypothetical protein
MIGEIGSDEVISTGLMYGGRCPHCDFMGRQPPSELFDTIRFQVFRTDGKHYHLHLSEFPKRYLTNEKKYANELVVAKFKYQHWSFVGTQTDYVQITNAPESAFGLYCRLQACADLLEQRLRRDGYIFGFHEFSSRDLVWRSASRYGPLRVCLEQGSFAQNKSLEVTLHVRLIF